MDSVRSYLLSVTTAAIICGIIMGIFGKKGTIGVVVKLLCGMFLAVTVISPVLELNLNELDLYLSDLQTVSDSAVQTGVHSARESLCLGIKEQTEAYILDKALGWNTDLEVEIVLSDEALPIPIEVRLYGDVSPYTRNFLTRMIESDLGIPREAQIWIG